jgi:hypothetical protein
MSQFTTSSSKEEILAYLQPVSRKIRDAMDRALPEARQAHHTLGLPLEAGRPYDPHYFAYTMRVIAKRNLQEFGVEAEIENDESAVNVQVESAALGGLLLRVPGFVIRVLKPDTNLDLPKPASESRALFYDQQLTLPFPDVQEASDDRPKEIGIVYLWDASYDFTRLTWQIAMPMNRNGDCFWKVFLDEEISDFGPSITGSVSTPQTRPPLASIAALVNSDLDYSPRTSENEEREEPRRKGASNGA